MVKKPQLLVLAFVVETALLLWSLSEQTRLSDRCVTTVPFNGGLAAATPGASLRSALSAEAARGAQLPPAESPLTSASRRLAAESSSQPMRASEPTQALSEPVHADDDRGVEHREQPAAVAIPAAGASAGNSLESMQTIGARAGTDKVLHHGYHRFYETFLASRRGSAFNLLEIGMMSGASIRMWSEYFPHAKLHGVDRDPAAIARVSTPGVVMFAGDQANEHFHRTVVEAVPEGFEVIVDDGGHAVHQQLASFRVLFDKALKPGGVYIIEDIEASYCNLGDFYGEMNVFGRGAAGSTVQVFKEVVDTINREMWDLAASQWPASGSGPGASSGRDPHAFVDHKIATVTFAQNAIIVVKAGAESEPYTDRVYRFRSLVDKYQDKLPFAKLAKLREGVGPW